jgi:hypothetical protein
VQAGHGNRAGHGAGVRPDVPLRVVPPSLGRARPTAHDAVRDHRPGPASSRRGSHGLAARAPMR